MPRFVSLVILVTLVACSNAKERTEARQLLDAIEAIHFDAPPAARRPLVQQLERLPLTVQNVVELRDACLRAHKTLLQAEEAQAQAQATVASLSSPEALTPEVRARVQAAIEQSAQGIEQSRRLFEACNPPIERLSARIRGAQQGR